MVLTQNLDMLPVSIYCFGNGRMFLPQFQPIMGRFFPDSFDDTTP